MEAIKDQKFIKQLVSNERLVRDKASKTFLNWLCQNHNVELVVFRKLWKALFYSLWMADKQEIQEQLSERLASVINKTLHDNFSDVKKYLTAFWQITSLEWSGIDRYRLDKYYFLLRKIISHIFKFMETNQWDAKVTTDLTDIISDIPLRIDDLSVSDGLRIFVCQIWLEEACKSLGGKVPIESIRIILDPFLKFIAHYEKKHISMKADKEFYESIIHCKKLLDVKIVSDLYFEYGSDQKVLQSRRKMFYGHYESLLEQTQ